MCSAVSSTWRIRSKYATADGRYSMPTPNSVGIVTSRSSANFSRVSMPAELAFFEAVQSRAGDADPAPDLIGTQTGRKAKRA